MSDLVQIDHGDGARILRLTRVGMKNALTTRMYKMLTRRYRMPAVTRRFVSCRSSVRSGVFCAGNDIKDFATADRSEPGETILAFLRALATFDKPVVADVAGVAIGIGTTMFLHCDHVVASDRSRDSLQSDRTATDGPHARAFELLLNFCAWARPARQARLMKQG